jgi:DNA-binding response OmpR family regulator
MDRILIIQDSASVNAVLKFRLEAEGFSIDTVETGEEGIEKAKVDQYQLVVVDYNLPGINGTEVCRILKAQQNTKAVPIIFMSAQDENKLRQIVKDAGADGYISEPFEGKELIEQLKGFIRTRVKERLSV